MDTGNGNRLERKMMKQKEIKKEKLIAYLILIPGVAFFIAGILLFDRAFISVRSQIIMILSGVIAGVSLLFFQWRTKKYGISLILFYGFFLGGPVTYFFIASTNYYLRDSNTQTIQLDIIRSGNYTKSKRGCRTPYVIVKYRETETAIRFSCDYENTISTYKNVSLIISEGFWGYTVFTDKKLND